MQQFIWPVEQMLRSFGWDFKLRSRLHDLVVSGTLHSKLHSTLNFLNVDETILFWAIDLFSRQNVLHSQRNDMFCCGNHLVKTSLTFKCLIEHLLADFSYSRPLDTYLWKRMMKMNRNITYKWCNIDKKHLLFTKRKCHKFSWLFTASRCSPRRRSSCACRIACKVLVSIGL